MRIRKLLLAALILIPSILSAQTYGLLTDPLLPFLDANGALLASGKVRTCAAGATCTCTAGTGLTSYSDSSGTPNTNPVVLDSTGKATIYGISSSYKIALCTSADVIVKTQDNMQILGLSALSNFNHTTNNIPKFGGSSTLTTSQITDTGTSVNIGTSNSLTDTLIVAKDSTIGIVASRASSDTSSATFNFYKARGTHASKSDVQNGDSLLSIGANSYSGGSFFPGAVILSVVDGTFTTGQAPPTRFTFYTNAANGSQTARVTINSSGYTTFTGRIEGAQGTDTAAANNLTLPANGNVFIISGATQINLLDITGWQDGSIVTLLFSSNPVVKHGQSLSGSFRQILLSGSVDFSATSNDTLMLQLISGSWFEIGRTAI